MCDGDLDPDRRCGTTAAAPPALLAWGRRDATTPVARPAAVWTRRGVLGLGVGLMATALLPVRAAAADRPTGRGPAAPGPAGGPVPVVRPGRGLAQVTPPPIRPRSDWGSDLPVTGPIEPEDDVRFLLVHHTASSNDYGPDDVPGQIETFYRLHTGPEKGWPDVAYNFFVDRFGVIWEGREGSRSGPVRGDATGGSQGYAQLCSLIGDYTSTPMPPEQETSLIALLAWLADRYAIDTTPGSTVTFTSRGSNRWPEGDQVTAATIAGHRDMSQTACPGDAVYARLPEAVPAAVSALRAATAPPEATSTTPAPATTAPPPTTPAPTVTTVPATDTGTAVGDGAETAAAVTETGGGSGTSPTRLALGAAAGAALAGAAATIAVRGRDDDDPTDGPRPRTADGDAYDYGSPSR
ncbi:MAG: peptidoglycan recognition family protein [Acidimicrobiales bacterium]